MADSQTSDTSSPRFERGRSASERLRNVSFPLAVRGYDRAAVDDFVNDVRALIADLEATQTREGVVQKTLDELGSETAGILQRAHETADEIAARSRSQADDRLQRAEREAELLRREADEYSEQVVVDTRLLWDERQRLIDDIRQLADEVLATADDAAERVKMPEPLAEAEGEATTSEEGLSGPIGLTAADANGPPPPDADGPPLDANGPPPPDAIAPPPPDEDATWALGVVENGPTDDETAAYELGTEEQDLRPVGDEAATDDESGHTVELEALPGGGEDEPPGPEGDEREPD